MIYLREVNIKDANDLYKITSNERVTKYLGWNPHKNIEETKNIITNFYLTKKENLKINSQAIVYKENNKVIGIIDLNKVNDLVEIGYYLSEDYWSQGIMSQALNLFLDIIFNQLNYDFIHISHNILNQGSERVILKNKFTFWKKENRYMKVKNEEVTLKYYYLKKDDYDGK